jgi:large subunit ribosomal protein L13
MKVYDGEGMILGRLASLAAKQALLGEEVRIINSEKILISGDKYLTAERAKEQIDRKGYPLHTNLRTRLPERFVRRVIRGMLPWKSPRGREAFKHVLCYRGAPEEFKGQAVKVDKESGSKLPNLKYTTVEYVCLSLGVKKR